MSDSAQNLCLSGADRNYVYVAKTLDAPKIGTATFIDVLQRLALPAWQRLHERRLITSVQVMQKVGDINLQTSAQTPRDWMYFVLLELDVSACADTVIDAERDGGLIVSELERCGIQYLSNELTVRPAGAGTAIPVPSACWPQMPLNQQAAIEYIHIPEPHGGDYRQFMQDVMGPVGARLVELGYSFQIQIMECTRTLHRDASLPAWNRIHILWGDFEDSRNGFIENTNEVVRAILGPQYDVHAVLSRANRYRLKPRMSKNRLVQELCIERRPGGPRSGSSVD